MWWDISFRLEDEEPERRKLDPEILRVMGRILELESLACKESALHGLGHWQEDYPSEVREIIDRFLSRSEGERPGLLEYAAQAREGNVE